MVKEMDGNTNKSEPSGESTLMPGILLASISLPGIFANFFAIIITVRILKIKAHRLSPNIFVLGLTCIDLIAVLGTFFPSFLYYTTGRWLGGAPTCKFQGFIALFSSLASGGVAVAMAVERLLAVLWPIKYRGETNSKSRAWKIVLAIVTGTATLSFLPIGGIGGFVKNLSGTFCTFDWFAKDIEDVIYSYIIIVYGVITVITLLICNIIVIIKLYQQTKKRRSLSVRSDTMSSLKQNSLEWQFGRMMVLISCVFLLCWTPFMVRIVCNLTGVWISESADLQSSRIALLNFVLDPFTYVLTRSQYRQALRDMCCRIRRRRIASVLSHSSKNTRTSSLLQEVEAAASVKTTRTETGSNTPAKDAEKKINGDKENTPTEMALYSNRNETLTIDISLEETNNSVVNADALMGLGVICLQSCENTLNSGSNSQNNCDQNFINTAYSNGT